MAPSLKERLDGAASYFDAKPERAQQTATVSCELVGLTEVSVTVGNHVIRADEPKFAGGTDVAPSPAGYILVALGTCEAITYRFWSERLEIPFESLTVEVHGDIDLRGGLGFDGVPAGYSEIRMTVKMSGSEPHERYEELHRVVEANCPVLDTLASPVRVTTSLELIA